MLFFSWSRTQAIDSKEIGIDREMDQIETHGLEEEEEEAAGDEEVTRTRAERKWVHGEEEDEGEENNGDDGNEDLVWIRLRAFIEPTYAPLSLLQLALPLLSVESWDLYLSLSLFKSIQSKKKESSSSCLLFICLRNFRYVC